MKRLEDSAAWRKSKELSLEVYRVFSNSRDFGFRDQIQRAAVSIMNNIAEGFERSSQKELRMFLYIAKGSAGEVRSMLLLARELKYISKADFDKLLTLSEETSKTLAGFIKKL